MKILVIGASQGTGALAVQNALKKGHAVSAFARSPQKLLVEHPQLTRVAGDFHDAQSVSNAVKGHDAVIITASATSLKGFKEHPDYFSKGTGHTITAMQQHGVKRLSVLSALGVGETRQLANFFVRTVVMGMILKAPFADHEVQEELVRKSGLDWIIARPGRLTDGPALGKYVKRSALEAVPSSISRADVADFLVDACLQDTWNHQAVSLGG